MQTDQTDIDLRRLQATARGQREEFTAFVKAHQAPVFRFACHLGLDKATSEDVLQDTFIQALRKAGDYRGSGSARAWLFSIARNVVRQRARLRVGEPKSFVPLDELGSLAGWGADDPTEQTIRRDAVVVALGALSPDEREVLILRDVEGMSGAETAGIVGISLAATKSRLHRARLSLAARLRQEGIHGT